LTEAHLVVGELFVLVGGVLRGQGERELVGRVGLGVWWIEVIEKSVGVRRSDG